MRLSGLGMETFPYNFTISHNHAPDHGVGTGVPKCWPGKLHTAPHVEPIVAHRLTTDKKSTNRILCRNKHAVVRVFQEGFNRRGNRDERRRDRHGLGIDLKPVSLSLKSTQATHKASWDQSEWISRHLARSLTALCPSLSRHLKLGDNEMARSRVRILWDPCRKNLNSSDFSQINSKFEISQRIPIQKVHRGEREILIVCNNPKERIWTVRSVLHKYFKGSVIFKSSRIDRILSDGHKSKLKNWGNVEISRELCFTFFH